MATRRATIVVALGATQTIAWASSYYMPAILGGPIANALHLPASVFFGLFSAALLLSVLRALALLLVLAVRLVVLRTHCCSSLECREYISRAGPPWAAISAPSTR